MENPIKIDDFGGTTIVGKTLLLASSNLVRYNFGKIKKEHDLNVLQ